MEVAMQMMVMFLRGEDVTNRKSAFATVTPNTEAKYSEVLDGM